MRLALLLLVATTAAHADPVSIGLGARAAAVPAGGDHGAWDGIEAAVETSAFERTSLRIEAAFDHIQMHSDEASYRYDGHQLAALAGIRVYVAKPAPGQLLNAYYAAGIGLGVLRTDSMTNPTTARLYIEPVRLGAELAVAPHTALRLEVATIIHPDSYDPLALTIAASLAFRL